MAYKEGIGENGFLDDDVLEKIDTGQKLWIPAAASFMRMKNDAKKSGVNIQLVGDDSAYRRCGAKGDYLQRNCNTGFTQWCAWEKYKSGVGNLAANPTTSDGCTSNHGYGMAIDVKNYDAKVWIRNNGLKYGWWWGEAPSENWHFTYDIKRDKFLDKDDVPDTDDSPEDKIKIFPLIVLGAMLTLGVVYVYSRIQKNK